MADEAAKPKLSRERQGDRKITRVFSISPERIRSAIAALDAGAATPVAPKRIKGSLVKVAFDADGDVVLKVRESKNVRTKVSDAVKGTRASRAFWTTMELAEKGVPVPRPVACIEDKERDIVILRHVKGETLWKTLAQVVKEGDKPAIVGLLGRAAKAAASIHAAGYTHGDLKPDNLIVPVVRGADLVVVDVDQARKDAAKNPKRVARDLAALDAYGQRLPRPLAVWMRKRAFDDYVEARRTLGFAISDEEAKALMMSVLSESRKKRARWRKAGIT